MNEFVTRINNPVTEECRTLILHDDTTLARLMVYAQSAEDSKLKRMSKNMKRSCSRDQDQTRFKKRSQT